MALVLRNDVLLLHIPRTGGTWVTDVLHRHRLVIGKIGSDKHSTFDHLFHRPCSLNL